MTRARRWIGALLVVLAPFGAAAAEWPSAGQNLANTRHQPAESRIAPGNAARLGVKWVTRLSGHISATPALDRNSLYIVDSGGKLYRIDRATGTVVWSNRMSLYSGILGDSSRATPVIAGGLLILGTQGGPELFKDGAHVVAVDKASGAAVWRTRIESHANAVITQSAIAYDGLVYVGVSSWEEYVAAKISGYECCTFRGSLVALDAATGAVRWKTYVAPDAPGYSGNAVWGGTPAIDPARGLVYITTGNGYSAPKTLLDCVAAARRAKSAEAERACIAAEPANYVDAFVAMDLATGAIRWGTPALPFDPYTVSCYEPQPNPQNCPRPAGPDYDFAQGPALFTVTVDGRARNVVGAGQKSGVYWTLDRDTGEVLWHTKVGPGSALGGMEWGSATDRARIYVADANYGKRPWKLLGAGGDAGKTISHGFWAALDAASGEILWQTADPNRGGRDSGAVSVANGVVFAGSMSAGPNDDTMFALDAATGDILWRFASGGSVASGAAVADGVVYWGTGYRLWGGRGNNKLYAFEVK